MKYLFEKNRSDGIRHIGLRLIQASTLVLLLTMALPARAADERSVKQRFAPVYPEIAKRMKIGGEVRVQATVDASGKVTSAKAISGNHMLSIAAEDAVRRWKFEPGSGESHINVTINFSIGQ